ncbi:MAG: oxidoreductase [Chloroflexi bacterium CFX4]|nr:oxidoreductase [Chloroflexi bacterium CFX4]MDL1921583.1 oxidoreductase [Chloroflexi bacterium CFX3]
MTTLLNETLKESIYMPTPARITAVKTFTPTEKFFKIALPSGFSLAHRPGQFVEVSVFGVGEAPISICSAPSRSNGTFEMCVRAVGKLTDALHRLAAGSTIAIRGPFGRGFPIERFRGKDIIFVAGGLGLAPLRSLIDEVINDRGKFGRIHLLYGTRTPQDILFAEDLVAWANAPRTEVHITVDRPDEAWKGNVGVITKLFPKLRFHARNTVAIIVGPPVMYKFVLMELLGKGIADGNIWLSFERQMKCAVGKCGHCQLHHIYTCQDGPAFSYAQVKHLEEAFS